MRRALENLSLFVLIVVVALRPLVGESYDSAESSITRALIVFTDPSPLRTLVFDLLILVAGCGWLLSRVLGADRRYRWTGLEIGVGIIALACLISCVSAGNKRLAVNASIDWLCYPVLTIVLTQLLHRSWYRRLLLAAVLASACVQAVECFDQYFFTHEDAWRQYESMKGSFWAGQGVELDSPKVELFERRMKAREAQGFMGHSNITGSYLVLCGFAALAVVFVRLHRYRSIGAQGAEGVIPSAFALCGTLAGAVFILAVSCLTGSKGALLAGAVGAVAWVVIRVFRTWINRYRRRAIILGWALAVVGILASIGHGLYHGSLPGASLDFRWKYWQASARMIGDHLWTGVGRENFGRHYTRYKAIDSPEEVANPHNLFVQATADWGMLGLVGLTAMLVGGSLVVTRGRTVGQTKTGQSTDRAPPSSPVLWGIVLLIAIIVIRSGLVGTDDVDFLYYTTLMVAVTWAVGFAIFAPRRLGGTKNDPANRALSLGLAAGLLAFLVHDLINFALFVPGTATTFFALLAVVVSERASNDDGQRRGDHARFEDRFLPARAARWVVLGAGVAVVVGVVVLFVMPVARARHHLLEASGAALSLAPVGLLEQPAHVHFSAAAAADRWDPTPLVKHAEWLTAVSSLAPFGSREALERALVSLDRAIQRDPASMRLPRMKARLILARPDIFRHREDCLGAITAAQDALDLYPLDPRGLTLLGDCRLAAGEALHDQGFLRAAVEAFQSALDLDDRRPDWEVIRRLRAHEVQAINAKITQATTLLGEPQP